MSGDGSWANPFADLRTALQNQKLEAGDTIYLRAGTHVITEDTTINASDITICPYPGETARIEVRGDLARTPHQTVLSINGDNIQFINLEIAGCPTIRAMTNPGEYPDTLWIDVNGKVSGDGLFQGCILHDLITCTWFDNHNDIPTQTLYRDCVVYNYGFIRSDSIPEGEAVYSQNAVTAAGKQAVNTIFGPGFSLFTQLYGVDGVVNHWTFDQCVFLSDLDVGQRLYIYPGTSMSDITLQDCVSFGAGLWLGNTYGGNINVDFVIDGCYLVKSDKRSQKIGKWTDRTVTGTTFVLLPNMGEYGLLIYEGVGLDGTSNWNANTYHDGSPSAIPFRDQNLAAYTFAEWQAATGFDADSIFSTDLPAANVLTVVPCTVAPKVAHLIAVNWEGLDSVVFDVSGLSLTTGGNYKLRNAYDPLVDYEDIVYDGLGSITVSMLGRSVAIPTAWGLPLIELDQRFGVWSLETL